MNHICQYTFQVNKPNGDIDFVTVYDLPQDLSRRFVENKYPGLKIENLPDENNTQNKIKLTNER